MMHPEEVFITVRDARTRLGRSDRWLYAEIKAGRIGARKDGDARNAQWLIPESAVSQILEHRAKRPGLAPADGRSDGIEQVIRDTVEQAVAGISESLFRSVSITRDATENGLEAIYPPRRKSERAIEEIRRLVAHAHGDIRLMGVSLRQFFREGQLRTTLLQKSVEAPTVAVKVLLLDPFSRAARARAVVEESGASGNSRKLESVAKLRETSLFKDLGMAITNIRRFLDTRPVKKHELVARFYDCNPFVFTVITHEAVICETYHFGREAEAIGDCSGELVPMFKAVVGSDLYRTMANSFDHLWAGKNPLVRVRSFEEVYRELRRTEASKAPRSHR